MQNSNVIRVIKERRSVRSYNSMSIPEKDLVEILEAGLYAPSGKNRQPWRFLIINDKNIIKKIAKFTIYSKFIRNAPNLILVYVIPSKEYPIEKDIFGVGACVQNILLSATEKGYDSCVIGELYSAELEMFDIKQNNYKLVCGISIGKSIVKKPRNIKRNLNNFLINNM